MNSPMTEHPTDALAIFTDYFVRNYPGPNTIIGDPRWHAPRIFRAAQHAMNAARTTPAHYCGLEQCPPECTTPIDDEGLTRTPSPKQIAAAWSVIGASNGGIKNLGPGLGVREIWEAMFDAGSNVS